MSKVLFEERGNVVIYRDFNSLRKDIFYGGNAVFDIYFYNDTLLFYFINSCKAKVKEAIWSEQEWVGCNNNIYFLVEEIMS